MPGAPGSSHEAAVGRRHRGIAAVHLPDLRVLAGRAEAREAVPSLGCLGRMAVTIAQMPVKLVRELEPTFRFGTAPGIEQLLRR